MAEARLNLKGKFCYLQPLLSYLTERSQIAETRPSIKLLGFPFRTRNDHWIFLLCKI